MANCGCEVSFILSTWMVDYDEATSEVSDIDIETPCDRHGKGPDSG